MAKREKHLDSYGASTAGVAMPGSETTAGDMVEVVAMGAGMEVRLGEPLLLLQDHGIA